MGQVFVSYSRADSATAERLTEALRAVGFEVWIDTSSLEEGRAYDRQIEAALQRAERVLVLWTRHSIQSDWVRNEAAEALRFGKLIPLRMEAVDAPLQFRNIQSLDFSQWTGEQDTAEIRQLAAALGRRGASAAQPESTPSPEPAGWRRLFERAGLLFADAQRERRFDVFYTERLYRQLQSGLLVIAVVYGLLAVADMVNQFGDVIANQFRAIMVAPLLFVAPAASHLSAVRRRWRILAPIYVLLAVGLLVATLEVLARTYQYTGATVALVLSLASLLILLLPFRLPEAAVAALAPLVVDLNIDYLLPVSVYDRYLVLSLAITTYLMILVPAWWREIQARRWFSEATR